jgi:hypothetical protein
LFAEGRAEGEQQEKAKTQGEVIEGLWREGMAEVRWRTTEEQPPAAMRITSPYEIEARYGT